MQKKKQFIQYFSILIVQFVTLLLLSRVRGLQIQSLTAAIGIAAVYLLALVIFWWLFINFFAYLPAWLYPLTTFILSGGLMMLLGNLIPGILITDIRTAINVIMILTGMSGILVGVLSFNIDQQYDKLVTRKMVARHEKPHKTDIPGFLFLEIDGLGEKMFRKAMQAGRMPTLKRWLDKQTHQLIPWETDFTSQTGAMQSGIMFGNNSDIPAYRWWDRKNKRTIRSGYFPDAAALEQRLSNGQGLLANGGTSRANMFSGDAAESMFTISTVLKRDRETGPGFYSYLVNPFVFGRLLTTFITGVLKEWVQALLQRLRKNEIIVNSRNILYAFIRAADSRLLSYLTTLLVSNDILRGIPAIYTTYSGFDNVGHFTGIESRESLETLAEIDREFARLEYLTQHAPRPYHIIVLSDHGQSTGGPFKRSTGVSFEQLVRSAVSGDSQVIENADINEAWDHINTLLSDSIQAESRMARVLRTMVRSKTHDGLVEMGIKQSKEKYKNLAHEKDADALIIYGSGSAGLIYLREAAERVTYETIQERYPDLLITILQHPDVGFVLVRSSENGDMVIGKTGIYFLDHDILEGYNPLADYSPHAIQLLKRESSFPNCPDIIVNTRLDPQTGCILSFENQVSHHGGLGGEQSRPFVFFPVDLPYEDKPLIGAESIYRLLKGWRSGLQDK